MENGSINILKFVSCLWHNFDDYVILHKLSMLLTYIHSDPLP